MIGKVTVQPVLVDFDNQIAQVKLVSLVHPVSSVYHWTSFQDVSRYQEGTIFQIKISEEQRKRFPLPCPAWK